MYKLRRFLTDYKKECIIGPLCKLFEAILELFVPIVMARIIDVGIASGDSAYVWKMGGLLVLLAVMGWSSAMFTQYFASKASQGAGTKIRSALFAHINTLSHAELDRLGTPSLITRITNDTNTVQQSVAMMIRLLTRAPFIIVGSLVMAMTINLRLSLIFFGASLLIALTLYLVMTKSVPIFSAMQKKLDRIGLIARENLSGNRVIRAFSKQKTECVRVDAATDDLAKTSVRVSVLSALLSPVTYAVTDVAIILIVWFGAVNVNAGEMRTGDIVALVSYMTQILLAMIVVANLVNLMTRTSASAKRINEVFETEPSVKERAVQRRRRRGAERYQLFRAERQHCRSHRRHRLRQDHADKPYPALLRCYRRLRARGRRRCARLSFRPASQKDRRGAAAERAVQRHDTRQSALAGQKRLR